MIMSGLIGVFCGLWVGCRFKVLALVPAQGMALLAVTVALQIRHAAPVQACAAFLLWSLCLQAGYAVAAGFGVPALYPRRRRARR